MTEKKRIILPKNRFSPVEYFLEIELHPERVSRLSITKDALKKQARAWEVKNDGNGLYSGHSVTVEGEKSSPIRWKIEKSRKGYYVAWIKVPGKRYTFQGNEIEYTIDC